MAPADRVDAPTNAVKTARSCSLTRRAGRKSERFELGEGGHPVLPIREPGDARIEGLDEFRASCSRFSANPCHVMHDGGATATVVRQALRGANG
jgi:hypothetical protein